MDAPVQRIADDWVPDGVQVHAYLMGSAGRNRDAEQRKPGHVPCPGYASHGRTCPPRACRNLLAVHGVATDGNVDALALLHRAPYERDVLFFHFAIVKLARQLPMGGIVLGDDHHAGRPLVEPVHDAGPQFSADAAQIGHMMEQRVHQRTALMSGAWVHDHARRLVDNDDVAILVEHVESDGFGKGRGGYRRRQVHRDDIALAQGRVGFDTLDAWERDVSGFDQALYLRARIACNLAGQDAVEPQALVLGGHRDFHPTHAKRGFLGRAGVSAAGGCAGRLRYHSMIRLSGASTTEMNCDVDSRPNTNPRSSPR